MSSASPVGKQYLLQQYCHEDPKKYNDFRLPELDALCELYNVPSPCYNKETYDRTSPFVRCSFPDPTVITKMAERSIMTKTWYELWGFGITVEECVTNAKEIFAQQLWNDSIPGLLAPNTTTETETNSQEIPTFDFKVTAYGDTIPAEQHESYRKLFHFFPFRGKSTVKNPTYRFILFADYGWFIANKDRKPKAWYLAREICHSNDLAFQYRLNTRKFIGPTSMPANLSFIMCNLSKVTANSIVMDPFVGTGSLLVSAAHFKAHCLGIDFDWRILHGQQRGAKYNIWDNFQQYKLKKPELICADLAHPVFKATMPFSYLKPNNQTLDDGFLDAIVCDPPYGVRAGARKSGRKDNAPRDLKWNEFNDHVPPSQVYDVEDVIHDLMDFSAAMLKLHGRLVYWLPSLINFDLNDLPHHPCLQLVSVSSQYLHGKFCRRLITMEKIHYFAQDKKLQRRDKNDPNSIPPKYANLKEEITKLEAVEAAMPLTPASNAAAAAAAVASTSTSSSSSKPPVASTSTCDAAADEDADSDNDEDPEMDGASSAAVGSNANAQPSRRQLKREARWAARQQQRLEREEKKKRGEEVQSSTQRKKMKRLQREQYVQQKQQQQQSSTQPPTEDSSASPEHGASSSSSSSSTTTTTTNTTEKQITSSSSQSNTPDAKRSKISEE